MNARTMTSGEIAAFNEGVKTVLDLAARSALAINGSGTRKLQEAFAVAALEELADSGVGLLIPAVEAGQKVAA